MDYALINIFTLYICFFNRSNIVRVGKENWLQNESLKMSINWIFNAMATQYQNVIKRE